MSDTRPTDLRSVFQSEPPSLEAVVNETRDRLDAAADDRRELAERLRTGHDQDNRPLVDLAGVVGLGCLLLGLASMAFTVGVHPASIGLVGLGVVLIGVYAASDWTNVRALLTARSTRYGANLTVTILVFGAILIVTNMLANRYYSQIDMTSQQLQSLSPQTTELLGQLRQADRKIAITAFYPVDTSHKEELRQLKLIFERYTHGNPNIAFEIVDPDRNPGVKEAKNITKSGTILVESGENSTRFNGLSEPAITGALMKVTNPDSKIVYFLIGHNELSTDTTDDKGLALLKEALEHENYEVRRLDLPSAGSVPADASALLLVRPTQTPLQNRELTALDDYIARGGHVMVLLEPYQAPEVGNWLAGYGLGFENDMVVDMDLNWWDENTIPVLLPGEESHPLLPSMAKADDALSETDWGVVTPSARSIRLTGQSKVRWTPLYQSSPASWGETERELSNFDEGQDVPGPISVFFAGEFPTSDEESAPIARLFVGGDADWLTQKWLPNSHNRDFALDTVNWLAGDENPVAIRPKLPNATYADLTKPGAKSVLIATLFGVPLLIAGAGVAVWWKRRTW